MVSAVVLLGIALLVAAGTLDLPYWADVAPGPSFEARWVALVGAGLAVLLFVQAWRSREEAALDWPDRDGQRRVLMTCALLWGFAIALPYAGFAASGLVFMLAMLMGVLGRAPVPSLVASLVTVAGGYAIFITWLQIKLPLGPWGV